MNASKSFADFAQLASCIDTKWSLCEVLENEAFKNIKLPMRSFNHMSKEVLSLEESRRFYVDILGFNMVARPPFDSVGYWLHGYGLNLHLIQSLFPEQRKILKIARLKHFSTALPKVDHFAFLTDDLQYIRDILDKNNVFYRFDSPPNTGIHQIFLLDPDGNVIEVSNCVPILGCDVRTETATTLEAMVTTASCEHDVAPPSPLKQRNSQFFNCPSELLEKVDSKSGESTFELLDIENGI